MKVRRCTADDIDAYVAIQEEEWGESMSASRAQLENRLEVFPEGMLVGEAEGKVVAAMSFVRLAGDAAQEAAKAPPSMPSKAVAAKAMKIAAARHAPGLLSAGPVPDGSMPAGRSGRWVRRGRNLVLLDA